MCFREGITLCVRDGLGHLDFKGVDLAFEEVVFGLKLLDLLVKFLFLRVAWVEHLTHGAFQVRVGVAVGSVMAAPRHRLIRILQVLILKRQALIQ